MESIKIEWFIILLVVFSIDHYTKYKMLTSIYAFPKKQEETILSLHTTLVMILLSIYSFTINGGNDQLKPTIHTLATIYFLSYLIMDIYIGNTYYPEGMKGLSGNIHHLAYIIVTMLVLILDISNIFMLFMISEIPTFLMSISKNDAGKYRNDDLFGFSFLVTRILLHIFITWRYGSNRIILLFGILSFCMHAYWFKSWCEKYMFSKRVQE